MSGRWPQGDGPLKFVPKHSKYYMLLEIPLWSYKAQLSLNSKVESTKMVTNWSSVKTKHNSIYSTGVIRNFVLKSQVS